MSGIAGIIHFDGKPVEPGLIEGMTSAMAHRGPDGINHWTNGSVALGQCMLRTTPESLEEHQPLTNDDRSLVLVMDGRVDNWEELRESLRSRDAPLRTRADAELVLRAYEIWGRECLTRIEGDFALCVWDVRTSEAFFARDRMGNKPLHYSWDGTTLAFSSDLHAILQLPWVEELPNEGLLSEFLAAEWYSRDETFWLGVQRLLPAHRMEVQGTSLRITRYWAPDLWALPPYKSDSDYIDHYRELLIDSVRRLSRSHRPVAYEVSGGLDSSAIFCIAHHLRRTGSLPAPEIDGYTLCFADDPDANELAYARAVGAHLGEAVHEIPPTHMPLSWYEDRARRFRTFPLYPNGSMSHEIYRRASNRSCVVLGGSGGDEWLGGSRMYYADHLRQWRLDRLYDALRLDTKAASAPQAASWLLRWGLFPLLPRGFQAGLRRLRRATRLRNGRETYWLSDQMQDKIDHRRNRTAIRMSPRARSVAQLRMLETLFDAYRAIANEMTESYLAEFGMEMRQPFNDCRFVQFAFSTPERLRLQGNTAKYIHVMAMGNLLPKRVRERRTKAEFSITFRRHLDEMGNAFTSTLPHELGSSLTQQGMERLFRSYRQCPEFGGSLWVLWSIFGAALTVRGSVPAAE